MAAKADSKLTKRDRDLLVAAACGALVGVMVALSYAAVPLYDWFCRTTGWGGTTQVSTAAPAEQLGPQDHRAVRFQCRSRAAVEVRAGSDVDARPRSARSSPSTIASPIWSRARRSAIAAYNVAPLTVGAYFQKINCFCFTEQRLKAGEKMDMPVVFYVDPAMARTRAERSQQHHPVLHIFPGARAAAGRFGRRGDSPRPAGSDEFRTETKMADAHAKQHDYHLVDPSPWPFVGSISAFVLAVGAISWMHHHVRRGAAGVRRRCARRSLHDDRLVARRHPRGGEGRLSTPASCRFRTATA